jgi:hypothetical protein
MNQQSVGTNQHPTPNGSNAQDDRTPVPDIEMSHTVSFIKKKMIRLWEMSLGYCVLASAFPLVELEKSVNRRLFFDGFCTKPVSINILLNYIAGKVLPVFRSHISALSEPGSNPALVILPAGILPGT